MSRGGRGGGRGGFSGRGGFGGPSNMPPMGLTFADIQSMSREEVPLFPARDNIPMITAISEEERRIAKYQAGFVDRLRKSPYYIVESLKTTELPRYSDKYRPQAFSQPTLKKKDLNPDFFPPDLYDSYFNPRKKKKAASQAKRRKLNLDEFQEDQEEEKDSEEGSDKDSQVEEDYDVDEEDDNDYAENYFDNGEEDNMEDMVGGDEGVGDYD